MRGLGRQITDRLRALRRSRLRQKNRREDAIFVGSNGDLLIFRAALKAVFKTRCRQAFRKAKKGAKSGRTQVNTQAPRLAALSARPM